MVSGRSELMTVEERQMRQDRMRNFDNASPKHSHPRRLIGREGSQSALSARSRGNSLSKTGGALSNSVSLAASKMKGKSVILDDKPAK